MMYVYYLRNSCFKYYHAKKWPYALIILYCTTCIFLCDNNLC